MKNARMHMAIAPSIAVAMKEINLYVVVKSPAEVKVEYANAGARIASNMSDMQR